MPIFLPAEVVKRGVVRPKAFFLFIFDIIIFEVEAKLIDTLTSNNIVTSKSEAKRLIEGGGIKIEDDQITDINHTIDKTYNEKILKIGKKKYFKIIVK